MARAVRSRQTDGAQTLAPLWMHRSREYRQLTLNRASARTGRTLERQTLTALRRARPMKLSERLLKTVQTGYIYGNGKLVLVHREDHKEAGTVEWCTIHDASKIKRSFQGRLVLHNRGTVRLVLSALAIRAAAPALEHGSPNCKKLGVPYGYVSLQFGADEYYDSVSYPVFINLVGGDFTVQPEADWQEPSTYRWGSYRIANDYALATTEPAAAVQS
jgi:hypothetical protein